MKVPTSYKILGFSLIETLISLTILSCTLLSMAYIQGQALHTSTATRFQYTALQLADNAYESLLAGNNEAGSQLDAEAQKQLPEGKGEAHSDNNHLVIKVQWVNNQIEFII